MIVVMKENCFIVSSCPLGKNRSTKAATVGRKMIRLINTVGSKASSSSFMMVRSKFAWNFMGWRSRQRLGGYVPAQAQFQ